MASQRDEKPQFYRGIKTAMTKKKYDIKKLSIAEATIQLIIKALCKSETKKEAAKLLGIKTDKLNYDIKKYKIKFKHSVWERQK